MNLDRVIAVRTTKTVYRDGDLCIKVFNKEFTKADVLNDFDRLKVAVAYRVNGERTTEFPFETAGEIVPEYREFEGWKCDINSMRSYDEFPRQLKEYIEFIERETGVPVKIISVRPDREETIVR